MRIPGGQCVWLAICCDIDAYTFVLGLVVLDVPSMDYLHNIESNKQLLEPLQEINETLGFDFISHFTPTDVVDTPQYQKFMRTMRTKMHWALNESNSYVHSLSHQFRRSPSH